MVVVSTEIYEKVRRCIASFSGLTIHCEQELRKRFSNLDPQVVSAILSKEWQKHIRNHHYHIIRNANSLLQE